MNTRHPTRKTWHSIRHWLAACIACLFVGAAAQAAPAPADVGTEPAFTLQVKSIGQIQDTLKVVGMKFMPEPMYKEFDKEFLSKLDSSNIKGIDTKKPMGAYAVIGSGLLQGDFSKSSIVVLVPVTDEQDFIALLNRSPLKPEKKGDVYSIAIPNAPVEASMQFKDGYAYITVAIETPSAKSLLAPKVVFDEKETSTAVMRFRIDRLPDDFKNGGLEFAANTIDSLKTDLPDRDLRPVVRPLLDGYLRMLKLVINDGKEVVYHLNVDAASGALTVESVLEPKKNSELARVIANIKPTKNDFADIVTPDSAAHFMFQTPLFIDEVKVALLNFIDLGNKKLQADPNAAKEPVWAQMFKTLRGTIQDGNLDFAVSLRGPDANNKYTVVGAFDMKDSKALESTFKSALKNAPPQAREMFKFDAFKVGNVSVHEIAVGDQLPPPAQNVFGRSSVYVALAPNGVFITFGAQAEAIMKEVAAAPKLGPKPAPILEVELSGKRLLPLLKSAGVPLEGEAKSFFDQLGKMDRISVYTIKIEGGDKLHARGEIGLAPLLAIFAYRMVGVAPKPPQAVPIPAPKK